MKGRYDTNEITVPSRECDEITVTPDSDATLVPPDGHEVTVEAREGVWGLW